MKIALAATVACIALFACGCTTTVRTSPDSLSIGPAAVSHLPPRVVALANGYPSEVQQKFSTPPYTLIIEQKQMTDTAIEMLRRALEKNPGARGRGPAKKVVLKVRSPRAAGPYPTPGVAITLDAQFGDGSQASVIGNGYSARGADRSFEAALLNALNRLLGDAHFIAYMKR
jgi:hypothetical protein